jgi:hypothetical protein
VDAGLPFRGRNLVAFMWAHLDSARSFFRLERASTPRPDARPLYRATKTYRRVTSRGAASSCADTGCGHGRWATAPARVVVGPGR